MDVARPCWVILTSKHLSFGELKTSRPLSLVKADATRALSSRRQSAVSPDAGESAVWVDLDASVNVLRECGPRHQRSRGVGGSGTDMDAARRTCDAFARS
jgi:hypothetical protein